MLKTLLCVPPDYDHNYPPLGTPALTAFLKKNGVACSQIDLNIGYRNFLARRVSRPDGPALSHDEQIFFLEPLLRKFFSDKLQGRYYSAFLPRVDESVSAHLPYGNTTNSSFYFTERLLSSEHLERYLEDEEENTFCQYYQESGILNVLEKEDIRLLGISVISPTQAIASLTLGRLVKKRLPSIHVTIGGQWPTLYRDAILQKKDLFRCFDSVIVFEGEGALCALVKRLQARQEIATIPNVLTRDSVSFTTSKRYEEKMDLLPGPDFDGLPLKDYDESRGGHICLTYETSRGCYWSKCAYCVDLPLPKPSYRRKDPALVARDMMELKEKYGAEYVLFGDPGLSPRQMREISQKIIDERVEIGWWTMARLDPGFDRGLFDLAHKAGLRQVNFGFETACDRVSNLLDKGNARDRSSRVIRDCAEAGIEVDLQTMIGLPGETFKDAMETVDFLVSHKQFIAHVTFNTYYLTPFNLVHEDPRKYGIVYDADASLPFGFFIPFKNSNGMDAAQSDLLEKIYHSLAHKNSPAGVCSASTPLREGAVQFVLSGESCRLRYRCDPATEIYTFIPSEDAP